MSRAYQMRALAAISVIHGRFTPQSVTFPKEQVDRSPYLFVRTANSMAKRTMETHSALLDLRKRHLDGILPDSLKSVSVACGSSLRRILLRPESRRILRMLEAEEGWPGSPIS